MTDMESPTNVHPDLFERTSRWAGDLDHPFYDDERNRWVWYEASAIGLQIALIGSYLVAGMALLVRGSEALTLVLAMMTPLVIASMVMATHVGRNSANYTMTLWDFRRSRGLAALGALSFFIAAILISGLHAGSLFAVLLAGAAFVGLLVGIAGEKRQKRVDQARLDAHEPD